MEYFGSVISHWVSYTSDRFPGEVELEGAHSYLANIPLADYGPSITVSDDDHSALCLATDNFCLSSLKVWFSTLHTVIYIGGGLVWQGWVTFTSLNCIFTLSVFAATQANSALVILPPKLLWV